MTFDVRFLDSGRYPQEKPDPAFPDGIRINLAPSPLVKTCSRHVPYPAPRCGQYAIKCNRCGFSALITVAGRPDDPKSVTLPCKVSN